MSNQKIREMIKKNSKAIREQKNSIVKYNGLSVYKIHDLPEGINIEDALNKIQNNVPNKFLAFVDQLLIGEFDELESRSINAAYMDGSIYITNKQDSINDIVDDVVHELAHALEEHRGKAIYASGKLNREYVSKMRNLYNYLVHDNMNPPKCIIQSDFYQQCDDYLFKNVGYDKLSEYTHQYLPSPYSATSLSEYWASCFEEYFLGDRGFIRAACPHAHKIITDLIEG